jgi:cholest-4-en-3-one 26-monooxygenase
MIGIAEGDRHRATALANKMVGAQDPDFQVTEEDGHVAAAEMYAICDEIAADRRAHPRDDIMSILVGAEVDGDRLTDTELNLFFVLLVVAGNETTRNLIAHAMLALIDNPDARSKLVAGIDDEALWDSAVEGRDEIEFTQDIAAELPMQAICEMIGIAEEDRHRATALANQLVGTQDPDFNTSEETATLASAELYAICDALAADRRANPRDDIMSILVNAEIDGDRLSHEELNLFFVLLVVAGNETTRNLIAHAMLAVIDNPDARAELVARIDDDELWDTAVEEMLRWGASIHNFRRTATKDAVVRGVAIKAGEKVVTYYASANRDEDVFADPHRFDIRRTPNDHTTFGGGGVHFCLGANLARLEIKCMMREFLRRYPDPVLAAEPKRLRSDFINGIKSMPMSLT